MKVIVEAESLLQVVETIKQLPVHGGYEASSMWVGCVIVLQGMAEGAPRFKEPEENNGTEKE